MGPHDLTPDPPALPRGDPLRSPVCGPLNRGLDPYLAQNFPATALLPPLPSPAFLTAFLSPAFQRAGRGEKPQRIHFIAHRAGESALKIWEPLWLLEDMRSGLSAALIYSASPLTSANRHNQKLATGLGRERVLARSQAPEAVLCVGMWVHWPAWHD